MKRIFVLFGIFLMALSTASAETGYVTDILNITLRSGPGINHRVIKNLPSGQALEVVFPGGEWTKVQLADKTEGWVLTRFILHEKTGRLKFKDMEKENRKLKARLSKINKGKKEYEEKNRLLSAELDDIREKLNTASVSYENLKIESTGFLKIKKDCSKISAELSEIKKKAADLEEKLERRNIYLGLLGAGIAFVGFVIGINIKRHRYSSSLR